MRQKALASKMCLAFEQLGTKISGLPTRIALQRAREIATFRRLGLYRNSMPRGASSGVDVGVEDFASPPDVGVRLEVGGARRRLVARDFFWGNARYGS